MKRGDIYYADLSPVVGSEQGGVRPVIVIQNNVGNRHSPTVIEAAITSKQDKSEIPTHVYLKIEGLSRTSTVLLEQIRTIDRERLKTYVNSVESESMQRIDKALAISIGLNYRMEGYDVPSSK